MGFAIMKECYNCGSERKDYILNIVDVNGNYFDYQDFFDCDISETMKIIEIDICGSCGSWQ